MIEVKQCIYNEFNGLYVSRGQFIIITVEWDNPEHTIILWDLVSPWSWPDAVVAQKESNTMAQSVPYDVYIIADVTNTTNVPGDSFSYIQRLTGNNPSNMRKIVLVGTNLFMRTVMQTLQKMVPVLITRYGFADTHEKARALLTEFSLTTSRNYTSQ